MVPKVFILRNLDCFCLKAHYLPSIHAKFHCSGSSGLAVHLNLKFDKILRIFAQKIVFLSKFTWIYPCNFHINWLKTIWLFIIEGNWTFCRIIFDFLPFLWRFRSSMTSDLTQNLLKKKKSKEKIIIAQWISIFWYIFFRNV